MVTKPKSRLPIPKTIVPLLTRTIVFLGIFIIFSGIIGPRIISHGLVDKDGFQIYGGAGKALLFGILALVILMQRKDLVIKFKPWHWPSLIWLALALLSFAGAWYGVGKLLLPAPWVGWIVLTHLCLLASIVLAAGTSFGPANLRMLLRTYKRELLIALLLVVIFYGFLYAVYGLWQVLAAIVLHSVRWLLDGLGLHSTFLPPRSLLFSKFGIQIAQYCSGIESIALFTALYALVGVLDWQRLNSRKYLGVFLPALLLLFAFNILRVAGLIVAGYYINPQIAFSLFHTYAGMIFFILYSILFWGISYRWMLRKTTSPQ